jgi:energy-coupling factor transporter ATP-binding protein EcfA2
MSDTENRMVEKEEHGSKIVSIKIQNFMSIKDAFLEFDERGIISLCGYNDSGKSAITRLFEVMFYNKYTNDQAKFITDGEEFWSCVMTFSDGVVYTREKYLDGKGFYELRTSEKILFTNKLENGTFAAMPDVPAVISAYLGVIKDEATSQQVNVRRNSDDLFLVETTGGQNYKMLNNILRSEVLTTATGNLNSDKNSLSAEVSEKETVRQVYEEQYNSYEVAPKEMIDEVKLFISNLEENRLRSGLVLSVIDLLNQLNSISIYEELKPVEIDRLKSLQNVVGLLKQTKQPVYDEVKSIDTDRLKALRNIVALKKELNVSTFDALDYVDVDRAKDIRHIAEEFNKFRLYRDKFMAAENALITKKKELKDLSEKHGLKICQNCGSFVN